MKWRGRERSSNIEDRRDTPEQAYQRAYKEWKGQKKAEAHSDLARLRKEREAREYKKKHGTSKPKVTGVMKRGDRYYPTYSKGR